MTTDLQDAIIRDILSAKMPDGTEISASVKTDTILSQLGLSQCASQLRRLVKLGIMRQHSRNRARLRYGAQDA
ncbi:hypothetical protein WYO_3645 [Methylobacterium sp. GXF4]|nr:hypothetical protein WYO_3645 [Methylobacterium sp. GXF4]